MSKYKKMSRYEKVKNLEAQLKTKDAQLKEKERIIKTLNMALNVDGCAKKFIKDNKTFELPKTKNCPPMPQERKSNLPNFTADQKYYEEEMKKLIEDKIFIPDNDETYKKYGLPKPQHCPPMPKCKEPKQ